MRTKLVVGNWKMYGSLAANLTLLTRLKEAAPALACEMAVCVPFPYLAQAKSVLGGSPAAWGSQNVSKQAQGAHTGDVAASMLIEFGCRYAIVGHSERRALYGETDEKAARKFAAAQRFGITPRLCIGETLAERELGVTAAVVTRQLRAVIDEVGVAAFARAVVAYEPVWAIGTGKTATPAQAQEVHALIRACVAASSPEIAAGLRLLYGGSVKPDNARELFAMPDIDGGLIGGASLLADDFLAICAATK